MIIHPENEGFEETNYVFDGDRSDFLRVSNAISQRFNRRLVFDNTIHQFYGWGIAVQARLQNYNRVICSVVLNEQTSGHKQDFDSMFAAFKPVEYWANHLSYFRTDSLAKKIFEECFSKE
jgi:hypothetical protein